MNNSWLNNRQWGSGQSSSQPKIQQQQEGLANAGVDTEEWQPMQKATPINYSQAIPGRHPFSGQPHPNVTQPWSVTVQGPPGQLTYQSQGQFQYQVQGQFPYHGQGQFPYHQGQGTAQFQSAQGYSAGMQFEGLYPGGRGLGPVLGGPGVTRPSGGNFPLQGSLPLQQQQQISPWLQQQQQQQQELEMRLRKEQKQRELEVQRRKMQTMDITKVSVRKLDNLISLPSSSKTPGSTSNIRAQKNPSSIVFPQASSRPTPAVGAAGGMGDVETIVRPGDNSSSVQHVGESKSGKVEPSSIGQPASQREKGSLMESTLSNLSDSSLAVDSRHMHNKSASLPNSSTAPTSQNRAAPGKMFAESNKARSWTLDRASLVGVFAQHGHAQGLPPSHGVPPEDHFGDFQSAPDKAHLQGMSGEGGAVLGQSRGLPGPVGGASGHLSGHLNFISGHGVSTGHDNSRLSGQQQHFLSRNTPRGHTVNVTIANQHPVPATSISGRTNKGYSSSDVVQSRSCVGRIWGVPTSTNQQQPETSMPATNFAGLDTSKFPAIYMEVYQRCAQPGSGYVSTDLVFPLLLSSQLSQLVLGNLWSMANRGVPGRLSQTELFVLLGLIAIVQSGNSSPTLDDLKRAPQPPVPTLTAIQTPWVQVQNVQAMGSAPQTGSTSEPRPSSTGLDVTVSFQQGEEVMSSRPILAAPSAHVHATLLPATSNSQPKLELMTTSAFPLPEHNPLPGDKYSVFADLQTSLAGGDGGSGGLSGGGNGGSGELSSKTSLLPALTSPSSFAGLHAPDPQGMSSVPTLLGSLRDGGEEVEDEFGSFSSGPPPLSVSDPMFSANGNEQVWTDFVQFISQPSIQPPLSSSSSSSTITANILSLGGSSVPVSTFGTSLTLGTTSIMTTTSMLGSVPAMTTTMTSTASALEGFLDLSLGAMSEQTCGIRAPLGDLSLRPPNSSTQTKQNGGKASMDLEVLKDTFSNQLVLSSSSHSRQPDFSPPTSLSIVSGVSGAGKSSIQDEHGDSQQFPAGVGDGLGNVMTIFGKSPSDPSKLWWSCLCKCSEVMGHYAAVLGSVEQEEKQGVLQEVAQSEEGRNRLRDIVEVFRLARRIHACVKSKGCGNDKFKEMSEAIKQKWEVLVQLLPGNIMEKLYEEGTSVTSGGSSGKQQLQEKDWSGMAHDEDFLSDTISRCSLCLMGKEVSIPAAWSLSGLSELYFLPLVFYGGRTYHPTCCNFWTNVVQERLPDLSD